MLEILAQFVPGSVWIKIIFLLFVITLIAAIVSALQSDLPPGPMGLPIVGCYLSLLRRDQHHVFYGWTRTYGPLISFRVGSVLVVVANDAHTIQAIHSNNRLSGRPKWPTLDALSAGGLNMAFQPTTRNNDLYSKHKKLVWDHFHKFKKMEQAITDEGSILCRNIEQNGIGKEFEPSRFLNLAVLSIIHRQIFGRPLGIEDPFYEQFFQALYPVVDTLRCTHWLNVFPMLQFVPGMGRRRIRDNCKQLWDAFRPRFQHSLKTFKENGQDGSDSLVSDFLANADGTVSCLSYEEIIAGKEEHPGPFSGSSIQATLLDTFVAATATTCSTFTWIILHLVEDPSLQQRIRDEIDQLARLEWSKPREDLPLLFSFIREILRMYRNVPLPYCAENDTTLNGYRIPKGTVILQNSWSLHNNESWDEPAVFNPNRFLDTTPSDTAEKNWQPFSSGRRKCPGKDMAEMELFLLTARLLKKFKFEADPECPPDPNPDPASRIKRANNFKVVCQKCE
ncbi:steroid 17-alpha-hydroxylase/17,20 lyase-like [Corticium candelabrum]|uniref:steroid 17-alpha-hydroxylase/17,20 lyase-like n=1 Tax=Corticium candelabrum TaxID=121492 RepID=UPI002E26F671|nr:steroid 17-alpha-hydroxylase/17,20 lyase-like [Corticium candelabrum]